MMEKCGMEEPLSKEQIKTTEFASAVNQLHFRIQNIEEDLKKVEQRLKALGENLSTLAAYEDFVCSHEPQWETDIFADRNEGKVLVMDNPFAQTNAAHLLKPLMDMADKMNTQLICFSGLGGYSIYERFDNIYVLNLVVSNLRGGMQYLRGAEEETLVSAQIEVTGQERLV